MDLDGFFGPEPKVIELTSQNRWEAIDELTNHLVATRKIKAVDKDAIASAVKQRETSMTTGIGFGIGLPHASTELIPDVITAIGRSRKGIPFDAIDGKPVNLVLLFLVPARQFQKHLATLANIAKLLHRDEFRDGLWRHFM